MSPILSLFMTDLGFGLCSEYIQLDLVFFLIKLWWPKQKIHNLQAMHKTQFLSNS